MGFKEENPGYPAKQYTTIANVCWPNRAIEFFWYIVFSFLSTFFHNFFLCPFFFYFLNFPLFVRFFKIYFLLYSKNISVYFLFQFAFQYIIFEEKFRLKSKNRWSAIKNCAHGRWRLRRMHNAYI